MLLRLIQEKKLKEYDTVSLEFANYCYKHNKTPNIKNNIAPTLTTKCDIAVVLGESK